MKLSHRAMAHHAHHQPELEVDEPVDGLVFRGGADVGALFFESWSIDEPAAHARACLAVAGLAVGYQWVRARHERFLAEFVAREPNAVRVAGGGAAAQLVLPWRASLARAGLATAAYGLALLLMLVAMTMNLGLFGSVLGGYFVGDALFLSRAPRPPSGHGPMNVDACCA